jgi:hypothetical protein
MQGAEGEPAGGGGAEQRQERDVSREASRISAMHGFFDKVRTCRARNLQPLLIGGERERERERTDRDRQIDRQTDRQTEGGRERERERERE